MKKRLISLLLTVVMCLSLGCIPALAADTPTTYGLYNRTTGSVQVISTDVEAEEYPMIAIVDASGTMLMASSGKFTADEAGRKLFTISDVGTIPDADDPTNTDLTGWEVVIRSKFEIAARGPLMEDTEEPAVEVTGVTLDKTKASIKIGETVRLTATVAPENATNKAVVWSSSGEAIATVDENGVVTGVAEGTATITVTTEDGGKTAVCTVTVTKEEEPPVDIPVTGLTLNRTSLSLYVGDTSTLTATVSPADATDKTVTWSSSNTNIATVTDGRVYAVGVGSAQITAKAGDMEAVCDVTVTRSGGGGGSSHRPSGGGSSGGGNATTYRVTSPSDVSGGKVSVSPTNAAKGTTVTITVTPDRGYELANLIVTDKDGNTLTLTERNGKYTFTMPGSAVDVDATFVAVTPSTPSTPSQPSVNFTDVTYGSYYYDAVQWAVAQGITNGTGTNTFSPANPCTRGQIVTFLWRAAGSPISYGSINFADVQSTDYYFNAVRWAVEKGITNGTGANTFDPNATCTRAQAVTFLYRYANSPAVSGDNTFADVSGNAYYANAVRWAVANQITNGTGAATFSPDDICTRGHIVTFMYRNLAA